MALGAGPVHLHLEVLAIRGESKRHFAGQRAGGLLGQFGIEAHTAQEDRDFRHVGMDDAGRYRARIDILRLPVAGTDAGQDAIGAGLADLGHGGRFQCPAWRYDDCRFRLDGFLRRCFEYLDAPLVRVTAPDTPVPYSPPLEEFFLPNADKVCRAARALAGY